MAEPILWTIETSLKAALDNIDGTGTYFNTLTAYYGDSNYQDIPEGSCILELSSIERQADESQGKYYWRATFDITAIVTPAGESPTVYDDQRMLRVWSDIHAAVMADPQRTVSATRYAIDTQVLSPQLKSVSDERVGITAQVEVYYRTSITDPTSL